MSKDDVDVMKKQEVGVIQGRGSQTRKTGSLQKLEQASEIRISLQEESALSTLIFTQ